MIIIGVNGVVSYRDYGYGVLANYRNFTRNFL